MENIATTQSEGSTDPSHVQTTVPATSTCVYTQYINCHLAAQHRCHMHTQQAGMPVSSPCALQAAGGHTHLVGKTVKVCSIQAGSCNTPGTDWVQAPV
jgi:hypothetical protein